MTAIERWTEEDRAEFAEAIADGMISEMTYEQIRQYVWDSLYDEVIHQHWSYILGYAEKYAPELLEIFENSSKEETSA